MPLIRDESKTGLIPIFPLPEICLLEGELLPLYVFEPRYRQLLEDALAGEQLVAMARFLPGWEGGYSGNPPVHPTMGIGRIVAHRPRTDGTSEIVLLGEARGRLVQTVRDLPYRTGRFVDFGERESDHARTLAVRSELDALLLSLAARGPGCGEDAIPRADAPDLPGRLARCLKLDLEARLRLLEEEDVTERAAMMLELVRKAAERERMERMLVALRPRQAGLN